MSSRHSDTRSSSDPIWLGMVLEPTGEIAASPYHILDNDALCAAFERWKADARRHGLALEVKDGAATSIETLTTAIERIKALMPYQVQERVVIHIKFPRYAPNTNFAVIP